MQFTKDSFYIALRDRLASANPQRTIEVAGETRPAVMVVENEVAGSTALLNGTYLLDWRQSARPELSGPSSMECVITFRTAGTAELSGLDRGRALEAMQAELIEMMEPDYTEKCDYSGAEPVHKGTQVFWSTPQFSEIAASGAVLSCTATTRVYFFPEVAR